MEYLQTNIDHLNEEEKEELEELFEDQEASAEELVIEKRKSENSEKLEDVLMKLEYRLALAGKHNLDYATLYHDRNGGYDLDTLTKTL